MQDSATCDKCAFRVVNWPVGVAVTLHPVPPYRPVLKRVMGAQPKMGASRPTPAFIRKKRQADEGMTVRRTTDADGDPVTELLQPLSTRYDDDGDPSTTLISTASTVRPTELTDGVAPFLSSVTDSGSASVITTTDADGDPMTTTPGGGAAGAGGAITTSDSASLAASRSSVSERRSSSLASRSSVRSESRLSASSRSAASRSSRSSRREESTSNSRGSSSGSRDNTLPPASTSTSTAAPSSSPTVDPQSNASSGTDTGKIVGGVVGGVGGAIALAALGLLFWFFSRKRRNLAPVQPMEGVAGYPSQRTGSVPTSSRVPTAPAPTGGAAMFGNAATTYEEAPTQIPQENIATYGNLDRSNSFATARAVPPPTTVAGPELAPVADTTGHAGVGTTAAGASAAGAAGVGTAAAAASRRPAPSSPRARHVSREASMSRSRNAAAVAVEDATKVSPVSPRAARRSAGGVGSSGSPMQSRETVVQHYPPAGSLWYDEWNSDTSPYATAGVGHVYDDEYRPPMAFHMQPGQLVRPVGAADMSPVGAFTQSSANGVRVPSGPRHPDL